MTIGSINHAIVMDESNYLLTLSRLVSLGFVPQELNHLLNGGFNLQELIHTNRFSTLQFHDPPTEDDIDRLFEFYNELFTAIEASKFNLSIVSKI